MSSCEVCDDLWQLLVKPGSGKKINLGSFDEALASECPYHTRVIRDFREHCSSRGLVHNKDPKDVGFEGGRKGSSTQLLESLEHLGCFWALLAVQKPGIENHAGTARVLDPDWVDIDIVNNWKRQCLSSHGAQCENPLKIPPASPAWLVDVEKKCIVPGGDSKQYVSLSYRSSNQATFQLHQDNLVQLQEDGVLDATEIVSQIPLKVRHAISLTAAMGERYLWTDVLCIDHSNRVATSEQLNLMTAIYAGAIFTIIAADGDRASGINGLKNVSEPRKMNQRVFSLGNEQVVVRNTGTFSLENFHNYHERGWTYQEFKMSPRKLLFMHGEAHWLCNCSEWHEELTLGSEVDRYLDPRPQVLASGFTDLGCLEHMLQSYNKKDLTFDEDALAAIIGLLNVFSRTFSGGFLYGLPEMMIDRALGWKPLWAHTNMRRRNASGNPSHIGFTATDLPSWSWVGWQGLFSMGYGEPVRINDIKNWIEEVTPITEWFTSNTPDVQHKRRIQSTWFGERERRKDPNQPLLDGWTRLPAPSKGQFRDEPMLYPDGCGAYIYKHHAMPDENCDTWYYPFDVSKVQISTPYSMPEQTRYLSCKTWKATMWSHRTLDERFGSDIENHVLTLRARVNEPKAGVLHLQTDDQLALWPSPESRSESDMGSEVELGRTVELVAINLSVHHSKTFDKEQQRYDNPVVRQERATVLWVEWIDGVAYRQACGHVDRQVWESLSPQAIDLVLG